MRSPYKKELHYYDPYIWAITELGIHNKLISYVNFAIFYT